MAGSLIDDANFQATTFHVIDFETTTPRGYPAEPIEVAMVSLRLRSGRLTETAQFTELMRPPPHAPVTALDTDQTGITKQMVAGCQSASVILARLDQILDAGQPELLVAHNAPTEAGVLYNYRDSCPRLATTHLLDTVRLARAVLPDLPSHGLDTLMSTLGIPRPADRHRAMADVQITAELFRLLLRAGTDAGLWTTLRQIRKTAGYEAKASRPVQETLFG
jgi:DNA polymerase III epsilon subunit-like protein